MSSDCYYNIHPLTLRHSAAFIPKPRCYQSVLWWWFEYTIEYVVGINLPVLPSSLPMSLTACQPKLTLAISEQLRRKKCLAALNRVCEGAVSSNHSIATRFGGLGMKNTIHWGSVSFAVPVCAHLHRYSHWHDHEAGRTGITCGLMIVLANSTLSCIMRR